MLKNTGLSTFPQHSTNTTTYIFNIIILIKREENFFEGEGEYPPAVKKEE